MGALSGSLAERARAALAAGCDIVLHCNGTLDEMRAVAGAAPLLAGAAARRAEAALRGAATPGADRPRRGARATSPRCWRRPRAPTPGWRVMTPEDDVPFETELAADRASDEPALVVDVEGFEGPLDLLLTLARQQKVDLAKISILALADQYLAFIEEARKLRLELAADYLVMAAWLAYLKSRLLLPDAMRAEGQSAEDMANALALRLKRLEAIRERGRAAVRRGRSSTATCSPAASPSRSPTSSARNGRRRSTICSSAYAPQRQQACARRTCVLPSARSGRSPRPARRSSA